MSNTVYMPKYKTLITISHYNKRNKSHLNNLISSLKNHDSSLSIIINDDNSYEEKKTTFKNINTLIRPNTGMNIGSWNSSYLNNRNFDFYIFLQDECVILKKDFIKKYISELSKVNVGMTGESINFKWAKNWENIASSNLNYVVGYDRLKRPIYRVQYYLSLMKKWGIQHGGNGLHLRSLIWGFKREILEKISPFPIGKTKEQCIAAEISISKKVEELGLNVTQIHKNPFNYISHIEWNINGHNKVKQ